MIFFENTHASFCKENIAFCRKRHFFMKNILLVQKKILPLQAFVLCMLYACANAQVFWGETWVEY